MDRRDLLSVFRIAEDGGLTVIVDRCLKVEPRQLAPARGRRTGRDSPLVTDCSASSGSGLARRYLCRPAWLRRRVPRRWNP
jgi:hypothetical protein